MSQLLVKLTIIFLVILVYETKLTKALRQIEINNIESRWSRQYFSNFTTYLLNNSVYMDLHIIKTLHNGLKTHLEFQIRLKGSKSYQKLFDKTLDFCTMVLSLKDTLYKRWLHSFFKHGNFMENCPVCKGHYFVNGWKLNNDLVPAYLYAGDYRIKCYSFFGKYGSKKEDFVVSLAADLSII